jgi:hypothetical protein
MHMSPRYLSLHGSRWYYEGHPRAVNEGDEGLEPCMPADNAIHVKHLSSFAASKCRSSYSTRTTAATTWLAWDLVPGFPLICHRAWRYRRSSPFRARNFAMAFRLVRIHAGMSSLHAQRRLEIATSHESGLLCPTQHIAKLPS